MDEVDIPAAETDSDISTPETLTDIPETATPDSDDPATQSQPEKIARELGDADLDALVQVKVKGQIRKMPLRDAIRYAQMGQSGHLAMQQANAIQKKAQESYRQLLKHAQDDPHGLLEVLNPKYRRPSAAQAGASPTEAGSQQEQGTDPRDQIIQKLEQKYESLSEHLENQKIEDDRKAIATEMDSAIKLFPNLDSKHLREYVKAEYRRNLQAGLEDTTIEDVAFHVSQELKEEEVKRVQKKKAELDRIRKNAPVGAIPAAQKTGGKVMSREDVMRLAGKI